MSGETRKCAAKQDQSARYRGTEPEILLSDSGYLVLDSERNRKAVAVSQKGGLISSRLNAVQTKRAALFLTV